MAIEEHSKDSVITAMNQFIRSVDDMDSTVLVPRRLMDIPAVQLQQRARVNADDKEIVQENIDLFNFYTMLVETRDEIKWGCRSKDESNTVCPIVNQLQNFTRVLNNLTDMAVQLKDRYEYELNNFGNTRNASR